MLAWIKIWQYIIVFVWSRYVSCMKEPDTVLVCSMWADKMSNQSFSSETVQFLMKLKATHHQSQVVTSSGNHIDIFHAQSNQTAAALTCFHCQTAVYEHQ